jgi:hypothetical protein
MKLESNKKAARSLCEKWMPEASEDAINAAEENFTGLLRHLLQIARRQIAEEERKAAIAGREYVYVPWADQLCPECGRPNSEHI